MLKTSMIRKELLLNVRSSEMQVFCAGAELPVGRFNIQYHSIPRSHNEQESTSKVSKEDQASLDVIVRWGMASKIPHIRRALDLKRTVS